MMARTVVLWTSFGLTAFGTSLALVRVFRGKIEWLTDKIMDVTSSVGFWAISIIPILGVIPSLVPALYSLRTGIEHTIVYKIMISIGLLTWLALIRLALVVHYDNMLEKSARSARWQSIGRQSVFGVATASALLGPALVFYRLSQGRFGAMTLVTSTMLLALVLLNTAMTLIGVAEGIDKILGEDWGVPLFALIFGLVASLLRTLVSLGLFGSGL